jgi:carboxyl-terminal processing protease
MHVSIRFFLTLSFVGVSFYGNSQSTNFGIEADKLVKIINHYHVQPIPVDDDWSVKLFDEFFYSLDPSHLIFTQQDLAELDTYKWSLDDSLKGKRFNTFLSKSKQLYDKKLALAKTDIEKILSVPLDFTNQTFYSLIPSSNEQFEIDEASLKAKRISIIKFAFLNSIQNELAEAFDADISKLVKSHDMVIREKIKKKELRYLNKKHTKEDLARSFLESIAQIYDPHTRFFNPSEGREFLTGNNPEIESFGLGVKEDDFGAAIIEKVQPASPVWNSNEIHKGDQILSVKNENGEILLEGDFSFADLYELLETGPKKINLSIRKQDGQIKNVPLEKEKIEASENVIRSFVLSDSATTIGYISLPGFYSEWNESAIAGCANDFAKEIIKLKKEKIEGLIVDVRFNGGGSLQEALDLSGIFVDVGALSILQQTNEEPVTLKDSNRGTIYDGPLVILVNNFSASAAELFAAAMQDHHRAIIVGSPTYGKATGQVVFPFSTNFSKTDIDAQQDQVKVTNAKLFRVTGFSLQKKGVVPDILLPDFYSSFFLREEYERNALICQPISKKVYYTPYPDLPVQKLASKSKARIQHSAGFKTILEFTNGLTQPIPLLPASFRSYIVKRKEVSLAIDKLGTQDRLNVRGLNFDKKLMEADPFRNQINQEILKEIQTSISIEEGFKILQDYINMN